MREDDVSDQGTVHLDQQAKGSCLSKLASVLLPFNRFWDGTMIERHVGSGFFIRRSKAETKNCFMLYGLEDRVWASLSPSAATFAFPLVRLSIDASLMSTMPAAAAVFRHYQRGLSEATYARSSSLVSRVNC
jgi:hypothetical protein